MFCCGVCDAGTGRRFVCAPEGGATAPPPPAPAGAVLKAGAAGTRAGQRWIDIHCHLFNILDLPALQFITRTRLTMPPPVQVPAVILVTFLVGGLNQMAMTAAAELKALQTGQDFRLLAQPTGAALTTEDAVRILAGREAPEEAGPLRASPFGELFGAGGPDSHRRPQRPDGGDLAVRRAANELFPGRDPDAPANDEEIKRVAERVDAALLGDTGSFVAWANGMARPRNVLTGELLGQFPEGADVLLTPAMVDYSRWLGIAGGSGDPLRKLDDQVAVMAEIARRRAADPAAKRRLGLVSFAPFCPWRHAEDRAAGRETVLDRVARWAEEGHVTGLKVYPPMGFRPFDNALRSPDEFPSALKVLAGPAGHPGTVIDDALREAYGLCERLGLVVMAHCGDSNEAAPGYGTFADPAFWGEALEAFPELRVNLGHFGGVFGFADPDTKVRERTQRWAGRIAALMERFPGLHADLGFGQQFIAGDCTPTSRCGQSIAFLRGLTERRPVLAERLMHGSDWVMVGMVPGGDDYADRALRSLGQLFPGSAIEDFRWRNAARLLGLEKDGPGRRRMARFLDPHAPGLLDRFDPDTPVA